MVLVLCAQWRVELFNRKSSYWQVLVYCLLAFINDNTLYAHAVKGSECALDQNADGISIRIEIHTYIVHMTITEHFSDILHKHHVFSTTVSCAFTSHPSGHDCCCWHWHWCWCCGQKITSKLSASCLDFILGFWGDFLVISYFIFSHQQ